MAAGAPTAQGDLRSVAVTQHDIAVTVIGGYLGAGKTTLVNHVLANADETIAVVVNDFGDIDIDASLIDARSDSTLALANGCICCSLVDGFASALDTIDGLDPRPRRLLIETSGVAEPTSVAAYAHRPGFELDAVVVLADASQVQSKARDKYVGDMVVRQLAGADIVVLNKTDLAGDLAQTHAWLDQTIGSATIVHAENSAIPLGLLFAPNPSASSGDATQLPQGVQTADELFTKGAIEFDEPVDEAELLSIISTLPLSVVRAKGFAWTTEQPDMAMLVQRVGERTTIRPWQPWTDMDRPAATHIVTIEARRHLWHHAGRIGASYG